MRGKYSKKKEIKEELNEMKNQNQEETEEKKGLPTWLKIGLGVVGGVVTVGGAYLYGEHKGAALASTVEDFDDEDDEDDKFFDDEEDN